MSRQQLKAQDKVTLKNTRDGLVEHNAATGEDTKVSKREAEFDLRGEMQDTESFSQVGKRSQSNAPQGRPEPRKDIYNDKPDYIHETQTSHAHESGSSQYTDSDQFADTQSDQEYPVQTTKPHDAPTHGTPATGTQRTKRKQQRQYADITAKPTHEKPTHEVPKSGDVTVHSDKADSGSNTAPPDTKAAGTAIQSGAKPLSKPIQGTAETTGTPAPKDAKPGKLQFTQGETVPGAPNIHRDRKLNKAQSQLARTTNKLEKARNGLPTKRKLQRASITDEKTGEVSRKLRFEKTPISQGEHIKGAKPLRPIKAGGNTLIVNAHRKLYQVEHDNTGVKAAHRVEMLAETGTRAALRHRKTAPYRKVAKLENAARKKSVNLTYRQAIAENPKLKSNLISRAMQKRKIKKDYAKAAREAQKAAQRAKKAGSATADAGKAIVNAVKKHPVATLVIVLIAFLIFSISAIVSMVGGLGSGGIGGIVASTYLAEDVDMIGAEAAYAGFESDLQYELDNYAQLHPGYDEYQFELDSIGHDTYVLISILSAMHEGAWTLGEVQGTIAMLFEGQYTLTETVTKETRYREVITIVTDPVTSEITTETSQVAYDYYICAVTLENFDLSHLPIYIMGEYGLSRYALLMATYGNRPDLFPGHLYPNASAPKEYGRYDIPPEYFGDEVFAAIITEAEKYLGMPYVWGGAKPETGFDCSGYVSWVINHSGWDVGRLGARALYGICVPVSALEAKPGDLVFFHSTYKTQTPGISHVGIYVGDGMMIHCGNPIGYASIETSYWQSHFYGYARLK